MRREYATDVLQAAKVNVHATEVIRQRAQELDALHIASAEAAAAEYFCTCDDGILANARLKTNSTVTVISPVDLIGELKL